LQQKNTPIPIFFACLIFLSAAASAGGLDLTYLNPASIDSLLLPVTSVIAAGQETPFSFLEIERSPSVRLAIKPAAAAIDYPFHTRIGFPTVWGAVAISPNLTIGGHIGLSPWQSDNIFTIGPFISSSWGDYRKWNNFSLSVNKLVGPDDFYTRNIHLNLARLYRSKEWLAGFGLAAHFMRCRIHVTDHPDATQNYGKTKEWSLIHLRGSLSRQFTTHLEGGAELDISTRISMLSLVLACTL